MVNKRLLVKNILAHIGECTFYDKKLLIDFSTTSGKEKLLKHISALSNSNRFNDSFIIIGISDDDKIIGTDFIDDSKIQDLVSSSLKNPPIIKYENISFPNISKDKSIGLLTIKATGGVTSFAKTICKIKVGSTYQRIGSKSILCCDEQINIYEDNYETVGNLYKYSAMSIKELLDNVFEFYSFWNKEYNPQYIVFKEQYVVCWSGWGKDPFYSEVDIQIINEGVRLFFSALHEVKIFVSDNEFRIDEYRRLGFDDKIDDYPFESTSIIFDDNGTYSIKKKLIFEIPFFPKNEIHDLYYRTKNIEQKLRNNKERMTVEDWSFSEGIGNYYFICYMNGIKEAKQDFYNSLECLDGVAAQWHSECKEILDKYENSHE